MITYRTCRMGFARLDHLAVMIAAIALMGSAVDAREIVLKGKNVTSKAESTWIQIGEDKSRGIGTYQNIGITFLDDGGIATYTNQGTYDWKDGIGNHRGFVVRTYPDGSTTLGAYEGTDRKDGDLTVWEGTFTILSGTGKFAGIKAEGVYKGTRYANGMSITDYEVKGTVPEQ